MPMTYKTYDWIPPIFVASAMQQAGDFGHMCMLHSSVSAHQSHGQLSRYSYISANPFACITADKGNVFVSYTGKNQLNDTPYSIHPLDVVQDILNTYKTPNKADLPPFQAGVMGWFGYDMGRYTENLPAHKGQWQHGDMAVGVYQWVLAFDHMTQTVHFIGYDFGEKSAQYHMQMVQDILPLSKQKSQNPIRSHTHKMRCSHITADIPQAAYQHQVQKIIDYIGAGDIFQANMTNGFRLNFSGVSSWEVYESLYVENPAPFSAYIDNGNMAVVSSSPERFLCVSADKVVETRPIKGTRKKVADPQADMAVQRALQMSSKDRAENIMIVDLLRNDLSKVCVPSTLNTPVLCGLETYESVHHLTSVVQAYALENTPITEILKACFPGGSITGAPRIRAQQIIAECEATPRGVYCGAIGYMGFNKTMDTNIAIRTMVLSGEQAVFNAGGGIVWDSIPQDEYMESLVKAEKMAKVFGQSLLGEV